MAAWQVLFLQAKQARIYLGHRDALMEWVCDTSVLIGDGQIHTAARFAFRKGCTKASAALTEVEESYKHGGVLRYRFHGQSGRR
jgi:hypothetical protein